MKYIWETEDERGDLTVEFTFHAGCPSQTSGPPERCYEGDPDELEISSVLDKNNQEVVLNAADTEKLENLLFNYVYSLEPDDDPEPDYDFDREYYRDDNYH
jgi:hypothetical protein